MAISDNSTLYFDRVTRTKQVQTINALAHATYYANGNKDKIINTLGRYLDELRDGGKGAYGQDPDKIRKQFMSKYTPGLEFGIWKFIDRQEMVLTDLAIKMVEGKITPEYYMSKVLLNYYQIINSKIVNPLYSTLLFMQRGVKEGLCREDINDIIEFNLGKEERDNRNAWYHILSDTMFFKKSRYEDKLLWNDSIFSIEEAIERCDKELLFRDKDDVKNIYSDQTFYAKYITK